MEARQRNKREFALQKKGFRAVKHQSFVGTGYFDEVQNVVTSGSSATVAMKDSTETAQFHYNHFRHSLDNHRGGFNQRLRGDLDRKSVV